MSEQTSEEYSINSKGTDFVSYLVSDLDTSVSFYRDTLGLELELLNDDGDVGFAEFALPPTTLALTETNPEQPSHPGAGGVSIALAVDDVEAATEKLRTEGMTVLMDPLETGVCRMAMVTDPDENPILLHRRDDGTHGRVDPFP